MIVSNLGWIWKASAQVCEGRGFVAACPERFVKHLAPPSRLDAESRKTALQLSLLLSAGLVAVVG